jgi:hypothetical protein
MVDLTSSFCAIRTLDISRRNLKGRKIAIIELPTNRWPILKNLQEVILLALLKTVPGSYVTIPEQ